MILFTSSIKDNYLFLCVFRAMIFGRIRHCISWGRALDFSAIRHFCRGVEYLFIRGLWPTLYMLCLTCRCYHHRNHQLSASYQDYLDTRRQLTKLHPILVEYVQRLTYHRATRQDLEIIKLKLKQKRKILFKKKP